MARNEEASRVTIGTVRFGRAVALATAATLALAIACGGGSGQQDRSPASAPTPTLSRGGGAEVPNTPDLSGSSNNFPTSSVTLTPTKDRNPSPTPAGSSPSPTLQNPSPTIHASPLTTHQIDLDELGVPICNTSLREGALPGFGTVPVPTPTPTPTPQVTPTPRAGDAAQAEVAAYLREVAPILRAAGHWVGVTEAAWAEDDTLASRAALLFAESRRTAALCNAVALLEKGVVGSLTTHNSQPTTNDESRMTNPDGIVSAPPEAKAAHAKLAKTLNDRQFWAGEAASLARSEGRISTSELEASRRETARSIRRLQEVFEGLAEEYGVRDSLLVIRHSGFEGESGGSIGSVGSIESPLPLRERVGVRGPDSGVEGRGSLATDNSQLTAHNALRVLRPERGRVTLVVPEGWIVSRADSQSVLLAPLDLQNPGLKGLGLAREGYGTALRVRRIRNAPGWTLSDAVENLRPLLIEYGVVRAERSIRVDGYQGVQQRIVDPGLDWVTRLDIVLAGEFTFFIEMGCPESFDDECAAALERFEERVRLAPK